MNSRLPFQVSKGILAVDFKGGVLDPRYARQFGESRHGFDFDVDNRPLAGIPVELTHDHGTRVEQRLSSAEGEVEFEDVVPDEATLRVVSPNYQSAFVHLGLEGEDRVLRNITLRPGAVVVDRPRLHMGAAILIWCLTVLALGTLPFVAIVTTFFGSRIHRLFPCVFPYSAIMAAPCGST